MKFKGCKDNLIILKLGGSVITKKEEKTPTVDLENLQRIAREISESDYSKLIIIHGAGSYGHPYAKQYQIGNEIDGPQDLKNKMLGFSLIHHSVNRLNNMVCDELRKQEIPAVPLPPSAFMTTSNKRIRSAETTLIKKYIKQGFIPVLYGDVVLDENTSIQMAVLSGDQIITYLAGNLLPEKVILATDVDGIYTKNPKKYSDAKLIESVSSNQQIETQKGTTVDVTGGMGGKIQELIRLLDVGIQSEIINANKKGVLKKAINGEKVKGTIIKRSKNS